MRRIKPGVGPTSVLLLFILALTASAEAPAAPHEHVSSAGPICSEPFPSPYPLFDEGDITRNNDDDKAEAAANSWQCQPCRQLLRAQALAVIMFCSAWLLNKRYMMAHVFISDDGPIN